MHTRTLDSMTRSHFLKPMAVPIWQVSEDRGRWRDFPTHLNQATEEQFKEAPTGGFTYVWRRGGTYWTYVIDFGALTQH